MSNVFSLTARRPPVWYDIAVAHHWDGTVQTWTRGIGSTPADRTKAAEALRQAADGLEQPRDYDDEI